MENQSRVTISEVLAELIGTNESAAAVEEALRRVALTLAGRVLRDAVAARLNALFQPHDCSIGNFGADQPWLDEALVWDSTIVDPAVERFVSKLDDVVNQMTQSTALEIATREVNALKKEIADALSGDGWKTLFPGKELLERFAFEAGFGKGKPVFVNSVIRQLAQHPNRVDQELRDLMNAILTA